MLEHNVCSHVPYTSISERKYYRDECVFPLGFHNMGDVSCELLLKSAPSALLGGRYFQHLGMNWRETLLDNSMSPKCTRIVDFSTVSH